MKYSVLFLLFKAYAELEAMVQKATELGIELQSNAFDGHLYNAWDYITDAIKSECGVQSFNDEILGLVNSTTLDNFEQNVDKLWEIYNDRKY